MDLMYLDVSQKYSVLKAQCYKTSFTKETKWCVRYSPLMWASGFQRRDHRWAGNRLYLAHKCIFIGLGRGCIIIIIIIYYYCFYYFPYLNWEFQKRSNSSVGLILFSKSSPTGLAFQPEELIGNWRAAVPLAIHPSLLTSVINSACLVPVTHRSLKPLTWRNG